MLCALVHTTNFVGLGGEVSALNIPYH